MSNLRRNLDHLATLLFEAGVTHWVVSPGSRNAPIVASFIRHGGFKLFSFPDERAAAFAALGISQSNLYPAGVICTSGTAAINLYPAVCEAFYQRTPLIVLTADRPTELIDQWDGQTIHQENLFQPHCLSFQNIEGNSIDLISLEKTIFQSVQTSIFPIAGPTHINVSLKDPIYEGLDLPFFNEPIQKPFIFVHDNPKPIDQNEVLRIIAPDVNPIPNKILCLVGQHAPSEPLEQALRLLQHKIPVLTDICSHQTTLGIQQWDLAMLSQEINDDLVPELLITVGMGSISKPLKLFLKQHKPRHIHICENGHVGDPFETMPEIFNFHDADFLTALYLTLAENTTYLNHWQSFTKGANTLKFNDLYLTEFKFVQEILNQVDDTYILHLGNSMSIRYASWVGGSKAQIYCNRGTSGIDGSLSTAVGFAMACPEKQHLCILGDISFIYDSHGMWTGNFPKNLSIIVLNNGGGQIFNWIDGPKKESRLKPLIETPQNYQLSELCSFYQISHSKVNQQNTFNEIMELIQSNIQCIEFTNHDSIKFDIIT